MKPYLPILLDGKPVEKITAFLFHAGGNDDPKPLIANAGKSFIGSYVLGMGFTFDDSNPNATSIAKMQRLIEDNPKNQDCIFPYIGGEEVNSSPTHSHHRYVINFGEMSEDEARNYPDLMKIVEEKVKPERLKQKDKLAKEKWWQFIRTRPELRQAIASLDRVLVISRVGQHGSFTFLPNNIVYSDSLVIIATNKYSMFAILQSRIHEIWARFLGSSMKDDLRYTPSDCFETYPFCPPNYPILGRTGEGKDCEGDPLEEVGKAYYEYRAEIMIKNKQGLTETYNRFHDPNEISADLIKLRQLHDQMDRVVLAAYGWSDLKPECTFLLDYESEEEEEDNPFKRQKKKPWRYRWTPEIHDEVLARLLELNATRYEEEILRGDLVEKKPKGQSKKKKAKVEAPLTPQFWAGLFQSGIRVGK